MELKKNDPSVIYERENWCHGRADTGRVDVLRINFVTRFAFWAMLKQVYVCLSAVGVGFST